jgi:predicted cupin superfamily sugar epimerase
MKYSAEFWIDKLKLEKHPEGGFFKEIYRSDEFISREALPERFKRERCFATSIYFLLGNDNISAFHRIKSDETWHFYYGNPVNIYIIDENGALVIVNLGNDPERQETLQFTVPKNCWFAASIPNNEKETDFGYCLVGCTVAPGFDFEDFEMAEREKLLLGYPVHREIIFRHTL